MKLKNFAETKLVSQINHLNLAEHVFLNTSFLSKPYLIDVLSKADLAVLPYLESNEGASGAIRTLIEAGVPSVTSTSSIFKEFRGHLPQFDFDDTRNTAAKIQDLVLSHPTRALLKQKQYELLEENSFERFADRLKALATIDLELAS